ncbi:MAG: hypothetical protein IPJ27_23860 [Candidatus Accumulibacter sp.]|uniref:Uncharacterized protein n=1 Tax=Candidatus Accumulibacter proximus TaxID=2954385 RepID=A0A935Q436_9PROT|nr:hypothetical protein [Candidatus Accumulibacter proximus]
MVALSSKALDEVRRAEVKVNRTRAPAGLQKNPPTGPSSKPRPCTGAALNLKTARAGAQGSVGAIYAGHDA